MKPLHTDWLFNLKEKKRARRGEERRPGAPPAALRDRQDEQSALLRKARMERDDRFAKAIDGHRQFAKFIHTLQTHEKSFKAPIAGVLDVDLVELAENLKLVELPESVKFLAVEEVALCVQRANKRDHGYTYDALPWDLPKGVLFTLNEFRDKIGSI